MPKKPRVRMKPKLIVSASIVVVSVVLDQITKLVAAANLRGTPGHSFLDGSVRLEYAENTGAFLSLGASLSPETRTLFFIVGVVVVMIVLETAKND